MILISILIIVFIAPFENESTNNNNYGTIFAVRRFSTLLSAATLYDIELPSWLTVCSSNALFECILLDTYYY